MTERDFGTAHVDICESGCKSLWFDAHELAQLDEHHEGAGAALREAVKSPRDNSSSRQQLSCPRCRIPMQAHLYQRSKEVNVDECYNCAGFFLDSGELRAIRDTFMSDEDRELYRSKLLAECPQYASTRQSIAAERERTEAIRHLTRYLRLSYWLGGS